MLITSYGIACVNLNNRSICMVKKLYTYSFQKFIRTKNINHINVELFDTMSMEEKILISTLNFDFILRRYKMNISSNDTSYNDTKKRLEKVFLFDNGQMLLSFINTSTKSINGIWEIPKGKKINNESDIDTAIREFKQETQINIDKINIMHNKRFTYTFYDCGKLYKYVYFLAFTYQDFIHKFNMTAKHQYHEICDIMWMSKDMINVMISKQINAMSYLDNFSLNIINTAFKINKNIRKNNRKIIKKLNIKDSKNNNVCNQSQ